MNKRLYIAVDFTGTISNVDLISFKHNSPNQKVVDFIKKAKSKGHCIIIWTCTIGFDDIIKIYLQENDIPYDYINCNPEDPFDTNSRKMYADFYLDDRAYNIFNIDLLEELL